MINHSDNDNFGGAKLALFDEDKLIVIQRDDIPSIPWPNHWDFPGGGREGNESAIECAQRELYEELGIKLDEEYFIWERRFPRAGKSDSVFFVAEMPIQLRNQLSLGDEGQRFTWMTPSEYFNHPLSIEVLSQRLHVFLSETMMDDNG